MISVVRNTVGNVPVIKSKGRFPMLNVVDTLQRILTEAESIGCKCPEGAACSVCEIVFLAREALEEIETPAEVV